uniref:RRM domain-containing protein n=1 Tax=Peronospora matthiolae TaxID=2874970 RepID=A0AAV1TXY0_9STRA
MATTPARALETLFTHIEAANPRLWAQVPAKVTQEKSQRTRRRKKLPTESSSRKGETFASFDHVEPIGASFALNPKRRTRKSGLKIAIKQGPDLEKARGFRVRGLVTVEELEHEDEIEELQSELHEAFSQFGPLQRVDVVRETADERVSSIGDVVVAFLDDKQALAAFRSYHGNVFGGNLVTCSWEQQKKSSGMEMFDSDLVSGNSMLRELQQVDEVVAVDDDVMRRKFRDLGHGNEVQVEETSKAVTETCGGDEDSGEEVQVVDGSSTGCLPASSTPFECGQSSVAALAVESLELVELVSRLLKRLADLQERAHTQNPRHSRRSRRFVLGMHEVRRGLLCSKIRLLVMAADQDECQVLDDKRAELVSIAAQQGVPTLAPMNRRKLGRVLQKSVRVSCVGVYSVEGANDLFRQLLQRISP